jgi:GNAT superfamily N-acetyltransferase
MQQSSLYPLTKHHVLDQFESGNESLDNWLRTIARQAAFANTSQTFVIADEANVVLGYYSLAAGSLIRIEAIPRAKRGAGKHPIPMALITRLAVTQSVQGKGIGTLLLEDAILRVRAIRDQIGIRVLAVHPTDEKAKAFYLKNGFEESPIEPDLLQLVL